MSSFSRGFTTGLLLLGSLVAASRTARARVLESAIRDADLVVRGTAIRQRGVAVDEGKSFERLTTVAVAESLKGSPTKYVEYHDGAIGSEEEFPATELSGQPEQLLCLVRPAKPKPGKEPAPYNWCVWAYPHPQDSPCEGGGVVIPLVSDDSDEGLCRTIDFEVLHTPDQVLALAREVCASPSFGDSPRVTVFLHIPGDDNKIPGKPECLRVPLDDRTAEHARHWVHSPSLSRRWNAAILLSQMQSPENADALKELLAEPASIEVGEGPTRSKFYYVRAEAAWALRAWDVKFPPSPLEEAPIGYHGVQGKELVGLFLGVPLFGIITMQLKRRAGIPISVSFFLLLATGLALLWHRSRSQIGEIIVDRGFRNRLTSLPGGIQYMVVPHWPGPGRFVRGSFDAEAKISGDADQVRPASALMDGSQDFDVATSEFVYPGPFPKQFQFARTVNDADSRLRIVLSHGVTGDACGGTQAYTSVLVPHSYLFFASLLPVTAWMIQVTYRSHRKRRRVQRGLCRECGYNLRGASDHCPECGYCLPQRGLPITSYP